MLVKLIKINFKLINYVLCNVNQQNAHLLN
jgi:hypothetical protein